MTVNTRLPPITYAEASTADFRVNFVKKAYKLNCFLVAMEVTPFPKLYVTDFHEKDEFAAILDFTEPVDLDGGLILREEIMGIKLFSDKAESAYSILRGAGIEIAGPKRYVFDKFIFLTLSVRLSRFASRREQLLEAILDDAKVMEFDAHNKYMAHLGEAFKTRFQKTPYLADPSVVAKLPFKLEAPVAETNSTQAALTQMNFDSVKAEEEELIDTMPFDRDALEPSSGSEAGEQEVTDRQVIPEPATQLPSAHTTATASASSNMRQFHSVEEVNSLLVSRDYGITPDEMVVVEAKVAAIVPSSLKELIQVGPDNAIRLRDLTVFLADGAGHHIKVRLSNNLEILKFLVGDDRSNNSSVEFMKLHYEPYKIEHKLRTVQTQAKFHTFNIAWETHRVSDDNPNVSLQDWAFCRVPHIDRLIQK